MTGAAEGDAAPRRWRAWLDQRPEAFALVGLAALGLALALTTDRSALTAAPLTGLTILVAQTDLGLFNVWGALAIASVKSALVIAYFMHMRYEGRLLRLCLLAALVTLAIFIGFTFFDVSYR